MLYTREVPNFQGEGLRGLLSDFIGEARRSMAAMPVIARVAYSAGLIGFIAALVAMRLLPASPVLALVSSACLIAFVMGAVINARCADEFYRTVYLHSCAITLPFITTAAFVVTAFGIRLDVRSAGYTIATWFVTFVFAFAHLRRR